MKYRNNKNTHHFYKQIITQLFISLSARTLDRVFSSTAFSLIASRKGFFFFIIYRAKPRIPRYKCQLYLSAFGFRHALYSSRVFHSLLYFVGCSPLKNWHFALYISQYIYIHIPSSIFTESLLTRRPFISLKFPSCFSI